MGPSIGEDIRAYSEEVAEENKRIYKESATGRDGSIIGHSDQKPRRGTEVIRLLFLAHHLGDSVPDDSASFLDLFLGHTDSNANLETGGNDLLGLEIIFE